MKSTATLGSGDKTITVGKVGHGLMLMTSNRKMAMSDEEAFDSIKASLDSVPPGAKMVLNSAEFYGILGPGAWTANLELIARFFEKYPEYTEKAFLSVKGGTKPDSLMPDSSPDNLKRSVDVVLEKLRGTKRLDLFQCARVDPNIPVEEATKTLAGFIAEGKFDYIGMSECRASTLRRANAVHHIAAVEIEVSPWSYDEMVKDVIATCEELGSIVNAYSPLGRGFLSGKYKTVGDLEEHDFRRTMERLEEENFKHNQAIIDGVQNIAAQKGVTPAQLCIAWVSALGPHMVPIPGSSTKARTEENCAAADIELSAAEVEAVKKILEEHPVKGGRYGPGGDKAYNLSWYFSSASARISHVPDPVPTDLHFVSVIILPWTLTRGTMFATSEMAVIVWKPTPVPDEDCFGAIKTSLDSVPPGEKMILNSSEFYGVNPPEANLELLARFFEKYPDYADKAFLSVKGGLKPDGLEPDSSPVNLKRSVDCILAKLRGTKKLDLFECARVDQKYAIEDTVRVLSGFVDEGKFDYIGLSESKASTLRRANAIHPIAIIEIEISHWTYGDQVKEVIEVSKDVGALIAQSPTPWLPLLDLSVEASLLEESKVSKTWKRETLGSMSIEILKGHNVKHNQAIVDSVKSLAEKKGVTPAQLCIAWVCALSPHVVPIPGSSNKKRTEENVAAVDIPISAEDMQEVQKIIDANPVKGGRAGTGNDEDYHLYSEIDVMNLSGGIQCTKLSIEEQNHKLSIIRDVKLSGRRWSDILVREEGMDQQGGGLSYIGTERKRVEDDNNEL
ncbi:Aldo/keto reductase [Fomitiporia mediterranea MF3/22]|uniref:Aldo/keto reductase n=1 Tax=Fomitiporia mediterranea (strain MF3/22) TaxID=694068 RepID=UPI0004407B2A|nr:Aldo/keto reductase [Fomitiporia mediterranea MF3/22]EJD07506.1 Aldo/keto reductase [Fomitiporia mediterranea MF3/22]